MPWLLSSFSGFVIKKPEAFSLIMRLKLAEKQNSETQSSTQRVYLRLRDAVLNGSLKPGDRLKVDTLKSTMQAGATPVREALSLLVSDQLVERIDQRGFRVASASVEQFQEVLKLRCQLEILALKDSLIKGDKAWEEALVLAHYRMERHDKKDREAFEALHRTFHMSVLNACGSPILMRLCEQLYDLNVRYRHLAGQNEAYTQRDVTAEHKAILDGALARDFEQASTALLAHYQRTGDFLSPHLG